MGTELAKKENVTVLREQSEPVTPMSLVQMAVEQGADIDKLSKLMDMQDRWEANEARKAFNAAVSKFRAECPAIKKTRQGYNSKYAGLAEAISQIKSLMESCGLSHSWYTDQSGGAISATCKLTHIMGHFETTTLTAEADKSSGKNSIQAIGSTVTYLQRYTLFSILGIASTDQDDDGETSASNGLSKRRKAAFNAVMKKVGGDQEAAKQWLSELKVPTINHATAEQLAVIESRL